jgi:uncharacterized protein (UPF0261 family)
LAMPEKTIALISTLDTKIETVRYLTRVIKEWGCEPILIDVGALTSNDVESDFSNKEVVRKAGKDLNDLLSAGKRDEIMAAMGNGASLILADLLKAQRLDGVLGIGGNQGTAISAMAMRSLPFGLPKYLVSTVASGNMRPYVGHKDITVVFSVTDLVDKPNTVSETILANAVCALVGMINCGQAIAQSPGRKSVALSALGNTEPSAQRISTLLSKAGFEVVTFHASGAGGSAMEELIGEGIFCGLIDLTPHELAEEIVAKGAYVPVVPGRMKAAARSGMPQVISTGALEYLCFGPWESIPASMRKRKIYMHNPYNANVRVSQKEMAAIGKEMAKRLNGSNGPVAVLVPRLGWSTYGSEGGALYDPKGYELLLQELRGHLQDFISYKEVDLHINDEGFADLCVAEFLKMIDTE